MKLSDYLTRIGFSGSARPDLATLQAVHRAHVHAIAFENLDVQLRRPVRLDIDASYHKLVQQRRGGWCYEMNGLLGWALQQIGFEVLRISAGVMRQHSGDGQMGGHLCLLVQLDQPYLVDVGFGGSLLQPLPLQAGERDDAPFRVAVSAVEDGYWRFTELQRDSVFSFDFRAVAADEALLAAKCHSQQTEPNSPFVQNLVVKQRRDEAYCVLRGRVFTSTRGDHVERLVLDSSTQLLTVLRERFELEVPEIAELWPAICARHRTLFDS
jgi:N-hydroxyarylamine O-acetyltransferase